VPHVFKMVFRSEGKGRYIQNLSQTQLLLIMRPSAQKIPKPLVTICFNKIYKYGKYGHLDHVRPGSQYNRFST
jgi:hypothetical protein